MNELKYDFDNNVNYDYQREFCDDYNNMTTDEWLSKYADEIRQAFSQWMRLHQRGERIISPERYKSFKTAYDAMDSVAKANDCDIKATYDSNCGCYKICVTGEHVCIDAASLDELRSSIGQRMPLDIKNTDGFVEIICTVQGVYVDVGVM